MQIKSMKIIEDYINRKNKEYPMNRDYQLQLDSQSFSGFKEDDSDSYIQYRADILYMITGEWSDTIQGALDSLASMLPKE